MRFASILMYVFFSSIAGQTAQTVISDNILCDNIKGLYGLNNPEIFCNDCRNKQHPYIENPSVTPNGTSPNDCVLNAQSGEVFFDYDQGRIRFLDHFGDNWNKLASAGYHSLVAKNEIPTIDTGRKGDSANDPNSSRSYYYDVKAWLEDVYHAWAVKDRYGSILLILLIFGLVGLIGIRRKLKKS